MRIDDQRDIADLVYGFDSKHQSVVSIQVDNRSGDVCLWTRDPSSDTVSMKRLRFHFWTVVADKDLADGLECGSQLEGDLPLGRLVGHRSWVVRMCEPPRLSAAPLWRSLPAGWRCVLQDVTE